MGVKIRTITLSLAKYTYFLVFLGCLASCGGKGGDDGSLLPTGEGPNPTSVATPVATPEATPISTPIVTVRKINLGAPSSSPSVIPPSLITTSVEFISMVSGDFYPNELILDEVDSVGNTLAANVATLKDDGSGGDAARGDRSYSGSISLDSEEATEKFYRVRLDHDDVQYQSGVGRVWVSGCPSVARPSNPNMAIYDEDNDRYVFSNEILVTLADSVSPSLENINEMLADSGANVVGCIPDLRQYLVELSRSSTLVELNNIIRELDIYDDVIGVEANELVLPLQAGEPNDCDTRECRQWHLDRIRAPDAWKIAGAGDEQKSVAVIDFGVNCNHDELDCVNEESFLVRNDHGTAVASLIGADHDNGSDLMGVAWNSHLYPYNLLASGSKYAMSELILQSTQRPNVKIINISSGITLDDGRRLRKAICTAIDRGRLVVAAGGDARLEHNCEFRGLYPARYNTEGACDNGANLAEGLVVVGATDLNNDLAAWDNGVSCANLSNADIFAPGKGIYSAGLSGGYGYRSGSSFAAPLVSGSAAVLWASEPELSVVEVHDQLLNETSVLSQSPEIDRYRTSDPRLEGKPFLDLYKIVGGTEDLLKPDLVPDQFSIDAISNSPLNTYIDFPPVIIRGIDAPVPIDIEGGFYSIDGGAFTSAAGMVRASQSVVVQVLSANVFNTDAEALVTVGELELPVNFVVTTLQDPGLPNDFNFINANNVPLGSDVLSNSEVITGIGADTPISIVDGEYSIDSGGFTSLPGVISSGQIVRLRVVASDLLATTVTATVTIGSELDHFSVTTPVADTTPIPFGFALSNGINVNTVVSSNIVTIDGINTPVVISVSGGEYSTNGEDFTVTTGTVQQGDTVQVRHTSANESQTSIYTTLTVGGYSATFQTTTLADFTSANVPLNWVQLGKTNRPNEATVSADGAADMKAADFDQDGDMDVLVSSSNDNALAWYENNGEVYPTFTEHVISTSASRVTNVSLGDVNRDGFMDFVVSSELDSTIVWYRNDAAATPSFERRELASIQQDRVLMSLGDMDSDGNTDIVTSLGNGGEIIWYRNTGDGQTFTSHAAASIQNGVTDISTVDLNNDGFMDMVYVPDSNDRIVLLENDGATPPVFVSRTIATAEVALPHRIRSGDIDNDGDVDLVSTSSINNSIVWYENDGAAQPGFILRAVVGDPSSSVGDNWAPSGVAIADMDGDGDLDVARASGVDYALAWYENDNASPPNFVERVVAQGVRGARSIDVADLNGDGDLELLSSNDLDDTVAWYETHQRNAWVTEGGTWWVASEPAEDVDDIPVSYSISHGPDAAFFAVNGNTGEVSIQNAPLVSLPQDQNRDNVYEVWIAATNGESTVHRSISVNVYVDDEDDDDDGIFDIHDVMYLDPFEQFDTDGDGIGNNQDRDDDNDGFPDTEDAFPLDVTEASDNDGDGVGDNADRDDDNDGITDSSDPTPLGPPSSEIPFLWRKSADPADTHVITRFADNPSDVYSVDIDGDGDQDIISTSDLDDTLVWYENDGATVPGLSEHVISTDMRGAFSIDISDLDDDGDFDIVVGGFFEIIWYENNGGATPEFTPHFIKVNAAGAIDVSIADIDGDGDMDVASSWYSADTVAWYESDGSENPSFSEHIVTTIADGVRSINVADINGDGHQDLLSASLFDDTLAWYESDGATTPSFTRRVVSSTSGGAISVDAGDFDRDGDIDIVLASSTDNTVSWFENDATTIPSFTAHVISTGTAGVRSVKANDIDGDGDLDVLSASLSDATIAWFENDGVADTPGFREHGVSNVEAGIDAINESSIRGAYAVAAGDINGDGNTDILSAGHFADIVAWHDITARSVWVEEGTSLRHKELAKYDAGSPIVYSISHGPDSAHFDIEPSSGEILFNAPLASSLQDFNGDNIYNVWVKATRDDTSIHRSIAVRVFVNDDDDDDDGVLDIDDVFPLNPKEASDFDLDGIGNNQDTDDDNDGIDDADDSAPFNDAQSLPPVWMNLSGESVLNIISTSAALVGDVTSVDLDNDGDVDIVSASEGDNTIAWHENNGAASPNFSLHTVSSSAVDVRSVTFGDINGDGRIDLLSASPGDDTIAWFANDGASPPNFVRNTVSSNVVGAYSVAVDDIDADGDLDVISTSQSDDTMVWHENNGATSPSFTEQLISHKKAVGPTDVATGDVDGDGDIDLLLTVRLDNSIYWYENNGATPPVFNERLITNIGDVAVSIAAADLDGDGDLDAVTAGGLNSWRVNWYENPGNHNELFTEHELTSVAEMASEVHTVDIDNDGDIDILASSAQDNTVALYQNDGNVPPLFFERIISSNATGASSVSSADLNNDGNIELIAGAAGIDTIGWYYSADRRETVVEGESLLITENASDVDTNTLTYVIAGGDDASYFSIDSSNGSIGFANAPAVSSPEDFNGDNIYVVRISVTDGASTLIKTIEVSVVEN